MINDRVRNKSKWKVKLLLALAVIILVIVAINLSREISKGRQINKEITNLEKNIDDISQSNEELKQLIEYFNSNAYIEEKARTDLGLKKEGEQVVVVSDLVEDDILNDSSPDSKPPKVEMTESNLKKWWKYFFE
ncbi:MAG: hypothetical protein CMI53_04935 [Parcubacteria group bacterium]|nr:hypothetical protein [Parcubacteria group bacterium]|tara:strand:- start:5131 stop:5532 length:402 start_codon:yes stop_codon:yes gene_type:complete